VTCLKTAFVENASPSSLTVIASSSARPVVAAGVVQLTKPRLSSSIPMYHPSIFTASVPTVAESSRGVSAIPRKPSQRVVPPHVVASRTGLHGQRKEIEKASGSRREAVQQILIGDTVLQDGERHERQSLRIESDGRRKTPAASPLRQSVLHHPIEASNSAAPP
jgi:hypothetical protein